MQKPMIALDKILFVGMDIHKDNHSACLTDCFGRRLKNLEISSDAQGFSRLLAEVGKLAETEGLKPVFGLEDSYGPGLRLANFLKQSGQEIKSVSPVLVDRKRRYETHPEKSDSLDAFGVAKVLIEKIDSLPAYSISKQTSLSKQLREINNDRRFLVAEQTRLKNQLHVLLHRNYGSAYKQPFKNVFSLKAMKYWRRHPCPSKKESCIAVDDYSLLAAKQIRRKISRLLSIREELKEIELELKDLVGKSGQKLETLNGCGTVLAAAVLGEIKDIDSFKSPGSLAKYAGLAPREKSSGKSRKLIKSRSGNRRLNQAIHHIALSQIGRNGNETAKKYFQKKISGGKSKVQALCCLKRRLADIIYLMLKHKQEYNYHAAD